MRHRAPGGCDAGGSSFQYGDYQGLAVSQGVVYAAWSDYRNPEDAEIFVSRVTFGRGTDGSRERGLRWALLSSSPSRDTIRFSV